MQVKCINDNWTVAPDCEEAPRPVFNQDYNVVATMMLCGMESFVLAELGNVYGYATKCFAILPDATADEIEAETKEAIVNLETALP